MSIIKHFIQSNLRCQAKLFFNLLVKGAIGFYKFQKRKERGEIFPAFQFLSLTNACNFTCQGCWVSQENGTTTLSLDNIHHIISAGKKKGSFFYGLLGGEPLLHNDLNKILERHNDCYFQLFTNGALLTKEKAEQWKKLGNVTPLISFEGDEQVADIRRGSKQVYQSAIKAIENCTSSGLITGVAISVCQSNFDMALSADFIHKLIDRKVLYLWYYIYRPSGANPQYELALTQEQIHRLRQHMVDARTKYGIVIIDSYWNGDGVPFCPAAEGLSHHINSSGDIEPCPVLQVSTDSAFSEDLEATYEGSDMLLDFKQSIQRKTQGCVLMEDPKWIVDFAKKHNAKNTSNRTGYFTSLHNAEVHPSHGSVPVLPEKSWVYRFAKNHAFFGLGAYG